MNNIELIYHENPTYLLVSYQYILIIKYLSLYPCCILTSLLRFVESGYLCRCIPTGATWVTCVLAYYLKYPSRICTIQKICSLKIVSLVLHSEACNFLVHDLLPIFDMKRASMIGGCSHQSLLC